MGEMQASSGIDARSLRAARRMAAFSLGVSLYLMVVWASHTRDLKPGRSQDRVEETVVLRRGGQEHLRVTAGDGQTTMLVLDPSGENQYILFRLEKSEAGLILSVTSNEGDHGLTVHQIGWGALLRRLERLGLLEAVQPRTE